MAQFNKTKITRYLNMARDVSRESKFPKYHLGAVAIYKGSLLAAGCNNKKTNPRQMLLNRERGWRADSNEFYNPVHAELACLSKIRYLDIDFSKVRLYIYREHKNGVKAMARPCPACRKMIKDMGIREVWYTTEDGFAYEYMED